MYICYLHLQENLPSSGIEKYEDNETWPLYDGDYVLFVEQFRNCVDSVIDISGLVWTYIFPLLWLFGFIGNCLSLVVLRRHPFDPARFLLITLSALDSVVLAIFLLQTVLLWHFDSQQNNDIDDYVAMEYTFMPFTVTASLSAFWVALLCVICRYVIVSRPDKVGLDAE